MSGLLYRANCGSVLSRATRHAVHNHRIAPSILPSRHFCAATEPAPSIKVTVETSGDEVIPESPDNLTPAGIVRHLDRFIVGQNDAKRAVAIAMRNRWRRHRVSDDFKDEIAPKNILMIGPTGCGKTEIARRLAKLLDAPFIKVEATKFTEVGFHGRDVDAIIRDLVEIAFLQAKQRFRNQAIEKVQDEVNDKLLSALCGAHAAESTRKSFEELMKQGDMDNRIVEIDVPIQPPQQGNLDNKGPHEVVIKLDHMMSQRPNTKTKKKLKVSEARRIWEEQEIEKLMNVDTLVREAIESVEQDGVVFIDEIDKICNNPGERQGADASAEGVQRDLLPLVEGCSISTKYGNVNTDFILFIASGAFHSVKPSDLLAELQGRLPIRVQLEGLQSSELYKILTEPEFNLLAQQKEMIATEGVHLEWTDEAVHEIADVSAQVNKTVENIGARRLHTVIEKMVQDISFDAADMEDGTVISITKDDVRKHMDDILTKIDLKKFVL